ncbi:MAG: DUF2752 domain-containing protein [Bacteroidetes bacterium]|nr:DUF2752 domain-containing protein [Bacteroidota bacterium]
MNRGKLFSILLLACTAGYIWLAITLYNNRISATPKYGICIIKTITNIPCPSCGSTRAVLSFLNGDILASLYWNPIGIILIAIMLISPFWILFDVIIKKSSLLIFYNRTEFFLRKKWVVISAILLILANWIWNIYKEL